MHFEVLGEVVGAREAFVADLAAVRLDARMGTLVASQLVGAGETPSTTGPLTGERFLPGVSAKVRLEVRTLGVNFGAARVGTAEQLVFLCDHGGRSGVVSARS